MAFIRWWVRINRWRVQATFRCVWGTQLMSVEAEDDNDHDGEPRVALNLEERTSRFENFDLRSKPNSTEDTVEEG